MSKSSRRVEDAGISTAGKMRLLLSLRSSCNSILPVPLNSSKITSSILLPVSVKAVAMIVKLPPFSILRAAPKKRLGLCNACASTPPDNTFPLAGATVLYARARRVILSSNITTSCPHSTNRFAFSCTIFATFTWFSAGSSKVEAMTSAFTERAMSVTSSGRSSISSTIIYTSGWLAAIALAISLSNTVLPVLGCATIRPRCPLPIGAKKSIIRTDKGSLLSPLHSLNFSSGNNGVRFSNAIRSFANAGDIPLIRTTSFIGKYLSASLGGRIVHSTVSPVFRLY